MAKLNLILLDPDIRYLEGIKNFFADNYSEKFNITCFTQMEILKDNIKYIKNRDVLLINEDLYSNVVADLNIKSILILGEGKDEEKKYDHPIISKYQIGPNIYKEIMNAYSTQNPLHLEKVTRRYDNTKLISVYSPIGGSGKSLIASALAMKLAESGSEVLYLNLEDVQSTNIYFQKNKDSSFSELIYYIKEKEENFTAKFIELVDKDQRTGVAFFNETESILDIEDLNKGEMKWMIEKLLSLNMYKYIIIDTASKFNSEYNVLLNSSDYIISPVLKEKTSLIKLGKYVENLGDINNYLFVYNRSRNNVNINMPQSLIDNGKNIFIDIIEDSNLYLNEGTSVVDSPIIANGILNIINTLGL